MSVREFPGGLVVKGLALSLLWLRSLLRYGFSPWPGDFCMPWAWPKKGKKCMLDLILARAHVMNVPCREKTKWF